MDGCTCGPAHVPGHVPGHMPGHVPGHMPGHMTGHMPGHVTRHVPSHQSLDDLDTSEVVTLYVQKKWSLLYSTLHTGLRWSI